MSSVGLVLRLLIRFAKIYIRPRTIIKAFENPQNSIRFLKCYMEGKLFLNRISVAELPNFVANLTGVDSMEIEKYVEEIRSKKEFNSHVWEKLGWFERHLKLEDKGFAPGAPSEEVGILLYAITRILKPDIVLETGVASGVSSAYILHALEDNKHGSLISIDLPCEEGQVYPEDYIKSAGAGWPVPKGEQPGWIIPDDLRHRWRLISGRSSEKLQPALEEVESMDIFIHDSEHSYENMRWEYLTAWPYLKRGGILLSHDVDWNNAFFDFCKSVEGKSLTYRSNFAGIVKTL